MIITCLPQGSSLPTHKSLLLWHRWDKTDQLPHPCPRTSLFLLVNEQDSPSLRNPPLIVSLLAWPPGLFLGTPALSSEAGCSGLLLLQGWGLGARGTHVYGGACSVQGYTHVGTAPRLPISSPYSAESWCQVQEERPSQKNVPVCYTYTPWTHTSGAQKHRGCIQGICQMDITAHAHSGHSLGGL